MAAPDLLDVKTDADYIALRRRMSRLRVTTHKPVDDEDDDEELSDEMLKDLIVFWKKNNTDIAKRFVQQRKERRAKKKATTLVPGSVGERRTSIEFEDLDMTRHGLRLKTHEPLHKNKRKIMNIPEADCTGSDETLSVRRPLKSANEQRMDMIIHRTSSKTNMCKAEEKIFKSKLATSLSVPKADSPTGFRPRVGSSSDKFRNRTDSGSKKDFKKGLVVESDRPRAVSAKSARKPTVSESESFRQRSDSGSSKSPPEPKKRYRNPVTKQVPMPITATSAH
ncbi:uncharacterized protein [Mytilus edulis]|uniref:uncharacterized protein n=1 Tax=Mytilus edulis TaxID=6550 RepID=UPI0039EE32F0